MSEFGSRMPVYLFVPLVCSPKLFRGVRRCFRRLIVLLALAPLYAEVVEGEGEAHSWLLRVLI